MLKKISTVKNQDHPTFQHQQQTNNPHLHALWEPNSSEDDLYAGEDDQEKVAKRFKCASEFDGYFFPSSNEDERAPSTIPDRQSSVSFDDNEGIGFFDDDLRSGKVHNGIYCFYL